MDLAKHSSFKEEGGNGWPEAQVGYIVCRASETCREVNFPLPKPLQSWGPSRAHNFVLGSQPMRDIPYPTQWVTQYPVALSAQGRDGRCFPPPQKAEGYMSNPDHPHTYTQVPAVPPCRQLGEQTVGKSPGLWEPREGQHTAGNPAGGKNLGAKASCPGASSPVPGTSLQGTNSKWQLWRISSWWLQSMKPKCEALLSRALCAYNRCMPIKLAFGIRNQQCQSKGTEEACGKTPEASQRGKALRRNWTQRAWEARSYS